MAHPLFINGDHTLRGMLKFVKYFMWIEVIINCFLLNFVTEYCVENIFFFSPSISYEF